MNPEDDGKTRVGADVGRNMDTVANTNVPSIVHHETKERDAQRGALLKEEAILTVRGSLHQGSLFEWIRR